MQTRSLLVIALPLSSALAGCVVIAGDPDPLGTLTVEWTIDGRRDPIDCAQLAADRLELVIFDGRGAFAEEIEPACESFIVSVALWEGIYFADATLVDGSDRAATATLPLDALDVVADTDLVVRVDFPTGSFS